LLDLKTIFGMREQMLPQEGFLAFLLENWLILAIVIMVLGFVIDQVLYIVRYRPQDKIKRAVKGINRFVLHVLGKEIPEDLDEDAEPELFEDTAEENAEPVEADDAPVIRRGGAKYMPQAYTEPVQEAPKAPADDVDAPLVVRAVSDRPVVVRRDEPTTQRKES